MEVTVAKIEIEFSHEVTDEASLEETCTDEVFFLLRWEGGDGGPGSPPDRGEFVRDSEAPVACNFCGHEYTAEEKRAMEAAADQLAGEYDDTPDPD